jgi:hypothetical protein
LFAQARNLHEFMSLEGVIDPPTWTFDYGVDPRWERPWRGTKRCRGILLGRTTHQMFEPSWSTLPGLPTAGVRPPRQEAGSLPPRRG